MVVSDRQRVDKWLFFARVVKSRSLAAKLAQAGKVRVNRNRIEQASYPLKVGDVLTITLERRVLVYRVIDPGTRRGPAEEARKLYEDLTPPEPAREAEPADIAVRDRGAGRPTKKDRRQLQRIFGEDT
ncbi:RNA-binding S4 domain-containing protein [Nitratireductor basaltis]|uniref:RNA-binding S4 domain-containing protein n=1 Tax=Nitratireductor basaltis TaxID=472175 RepID=A0A084U724_9HYPH|nr:RNA-binding S4 domain-containing protein [Nitratireductor basaltis]KFB08760.1 RNA-binding S4 domain-containing protein [Nitratireductor basaltis]